MRVPGRVHISWADENTLKMETDAGTQTRLFHFSGKAAAANVNALAWQGYSAANWERPVRGSGAPGFGLRRHARRCPRQSAGSSDHAIAQAGYLRKNGPPYSENTVLKEYYDPFIKSATATPGSP